MGEHSGSNDFSLRCRVCPRFRTTDFSQWHDHFEKNYSTCKGMDFHAELKSLQKSNMKGRGRKNKKRKRNKKTKLFVTFAKFSLKNLPSYIWSILMENGTRI